MSESDTNRSLQIETCKQILRDEVRRGKLDLEGLIDALAHAKVFEKELLDDIDNLIETIEKQAEFLKTLEDSFDTVSQGLKSYALQNNQQIEGLVKVAHESMKDALLVGAKLQKEAHKSVAQENGKKGPRAKVQNRQEVNNYVFSKMKEHVSDGLTIDKAAELVSKSVEKEWKSLNKNKKTGDSPFFRGNKIEGVKRIYFKLNKKPA